MISNKLQLTALLIVCIIICASQGKEQNSHSISHFEAFTLRAKDHLTASCDVPNKRPPPEKRLFRSTAVDNFVEQVCSKIGDPELASLFVNCFPNTLDTTVLHFDDSGADAFIITGDIPAMWLRDSAAQLWPYLPLMSNDIKLRMLIRGAVMRHARSILIDPYANAFVYNSSQSPWINDSRIPPMTDKLWEGKYELDSLVWIRLADLPIGCALGHRAMTTVLDVIEYQQQASANMRDTDRLYYRFGRRTQDSIDTLFKGIGQPGRACGLSRSPFRPSDDAHVLPYHIPSNAFAVIALNELGNILTLPGCKFATTVPIAERAARIAETIASGLRKYGIVNTPSAGSIFAYEVDGFGSFYLMDDANLPSLLSLPYFGFVEANDSVYERTRQFILSDRNIYYFSNSTTKLHGIGSPHTEHGYIWPMSVIMRAMTSNNDSEIKECLEILKKSSAGTGFIHESFSKDDPSQYTRSWFAFVNGLFGSLIVKLVEERPYLLR